MQNFSFPSFYAEVLNLLKLNELKLDKSNTDKKFKK